MEKSNVISLIEKADELVSKYDEITYALFKIMSRIITSDLDKSTFVNDIISDADKSSEECKPIIVAVDIIMNASMCLLDKNFKKKHWECAKFSEEVEPILLQILMQNINTFGLRTLFQILRKKHPLFKNMRETMKDLKEKYDKCMSGDH